MPFKVKTSIIDKDTGFNKFKEELNKLSKGTYVKLGIIGQKALNNKDYRDDQGKIKQSPATLVDVATFHEFGSSDGKHPPRRSFLRSTYDDKKEIWRAYLIKQGEKLIHSLSLKAIFEAANQALGRLGLMMLKDTQLKFTDNDWPELSDYTVSKRKSESSKKTSYIDLDTEDKKKRHKPLIDTGQLRRSIQFIVARGKE